MNQCRSVHAYWGRCELPIGHDVEHKAKHRVKSLADDYVYCYWRDGSQGERFA